MSFLSLAMDRAFLDFNFCEVLDPTLKPGNGPTNIGLFKLVYEARQGDRFATFEFTEHHRDCPARAPHEQRLRSAGNPCQGPIGRPALGWTPNMATFER